MTKIMAAILLAASLVLAAWSFRGIVCRYRRISGFPWLFSLGFAAAATAALVALRVLLAP